MAFQYAPQGNIPIPDLEFKENIKLNSAETALIIVDMQNDFIKPGGSLVVPAAMATLPHIQGLLMKGRRHGVKVAYTRDTQFSDDPEFKIWPQHCLKGTWGWQIVEELAPLDTEMIIEKNRYDGFFGSALDYYLSRVWKVKNLIITGTVANICVLHTAASAALRWFHIIMPANSVSAL
ncbi:MAG: isochorismatase family cysteine hydrolase, partial [Calditrichia bacterium]